MTMIRITNSSDVNVLNQKHEIIQSLQEDAHGYGLKTVQNILDRNNGFVTFSEQNNEFTSTVLLAMNESEYSK